MEKRHPVRYAVIGLGHISQVALLPAFQHARADALLAALVSGDEDKRKQLGKHYGVPTYDYADLEDCIQNERIEAVYVGVPNHLHADVTLRALRAGAHVLCEKPMAVTSEECRAMIRAAEQEERRLMIAYRLHFEPANLRAIDLVQGGRLGTPRFFQSIHSMQVRPGNVRLEREMGGGPLYDIGIYCINAARYIFQQEPIEVVAATVASADGRFAEIEEAASVVMRFPEERLATFTCSFGAADVSSYRVVGTDGDLLVEPAFEYTGSLVHRLHREGDTRRRRFPRGDQFAPELIHLARCIREEQEPEPSGEEGLVDVLILEGIFRAAESGKSVRLELPERSRRPNLALALHKPPVRKPRTVDVESASQ